MSKESMKKDEQIKLKRKRGFSLIELLAVIIIIGIISVIAVGSVTRYIDGARQEKVQQNKNNALVAAKLYLQENRSEFPLLIGDATKIKFSALRKANYIKEDVTNDKGEDCMANSFVRVYKLDDEEYSYYTYLYCGDDVVPADVEPPKPAVTDFQFKGGNFSSGSFNDIKNASFSFKIKGAEDDDTVGIYSYQYTIYVENDESSYDEVFSTGTLKAGLETSLNVESKNLSSYLSITGFSSIKVVVVAINEQGGRVDYTSIIGDYNDKVSPLCTEVQGDALNDDDWINKVDYASRDTISTKRGYARITVGCNDGNGSGCKRDFFTRTWPNDEMSDSGTVNYKYGTRWGYVLLEDNARKENTTKCYVRANIDLQAPTVVVTVYSKNGTKRSKVAELTVQDDKVINAKVPEGTIYANDYLSLVGSQSEKWMNALYYKDGIELDVKVTDNLYLYSYEWDVNNPYVSGGTSNSVIQSTVSYQNGIAEQGSGTSAKGTFTSNLVDNPTNDEELKLAEHGLLSGDIKGLKLYREGKRYGKLSVCDKAGNCTVVHIFANIDITAPPVPEVSYQKNNTKSTYIPGTESSYKDSNNWSNEQVYAYIDGYRYDNLTQGGVTSELSGWDHFDYIYRKQTGKNSSTYTWNNPDKVRVVPATGGNYQYGFTVKDQGTHIVTFDSCDIAGNCSSMSVKDYVKVDTIAPTCGIIKTYHGTSGPNSAGWLKKGESVTFSHSCTDEDSKYSSGCNAQHPNNLETYTYATNIQTSTAGVLGNNKGGYVYDYAGNKSKECPKNEKVKIDINPPTCNTKITTSNSSGPTYDQNWTKSKVVITGMCSDTGGSGCSVSPTTTYTDDIDQNVSFTKSVVDVAGNATACSHQYRVRIDNTKPTGSCTISGHYTKDKDSSYAIVVNYTQDPLKNGAASGIKDVKYKKTGDSSYNYSTTMSLTCNSSGNKTGSIQITDNIGNVNTIQCSGSISVPVCCSYNSVYYTDGGTCSASCGDYGTYNRKAWSIYNDNACSSFNTSSGGSACNRRDCCNSNKTYSYETSCSKSCGGGEMYVYYVSKFDSSIDCGNQKYSCNTQSCGPANGNNCAVRGSRKRSVSTWYDCTGGDSPHSQAYYHYCWDGEKYVTKGQNSSLNTFWYVCPNKPYGTGDGWTIIND